MMPAHLRSIDPAVVLARYWESYHKAVADYAETRSHDVVLTVRGVAVTFNTKSGHGDGHLSDDRGVSVWRRVGSQGQHLYRASVWTWPKGPWAYTRRYCRSAPKALTALANAIGEDWK